MNCECTEYYAKEHGFALYGVMFDYDEDDDDDDFYGLLLRLTPCPMLI